MAATPDDHALARRLAVEAGELLVELRASLERDGARPSEVKAAGDRRSHLFLIEQLAARRPADEVLSEESGGETVAGMISRTSATRCWIVDPLDGTREYGEPGRSDWAVHVALCIDGHPVVGAVSLPADGLVFATADPPPFPPPVTPPTVVVSRSRPPASAQRVARALGAVQQPLGSAGAKAMAVVRGHASAYPHSGGQYEWDSCAPVAVALSTGLWCSRLSGEPLQYNRPDPYLPDLLICRPDVAATAIAAAEWFL